MVSTASTELALGRDTRYREGSAVRSHPAAPEGIGNLSLTSQRCLEPTTPGVKNPLLFLCPRDKLRIADWDIFS